MFRLRYYPQRSNATMDSEISDRLQKTNETFREFVDALQTLMQRRGGITPSQQIDRIFINMNPAYRRHMRRTDIQGILDLYRMIAEYEEIEKAEAEYRALIAPKTDTDFKSKKNITEKTQGQQTPSTIAIAGNAAGNAVNEATKETSANDQPGSSASNAESKEY